jgi:hypothetical protein
VQQSLQGGREVFILSTLASSTLIKLFSENVENFKNYFFQFKKYREGK